MSSLSDAVKFNDWLGHLPHRHKIVVAGAAILIFGISSVTLDKYLPLMVTISPQVTTKLDSTPKSCLRMRRGSYKTKAFTLKAFIFMGLHGTELGDPFFG